MQITANVSAGILPGPSSCTLTQQLAALPSLFSSDGLLSSQHTSFCALVVAFPCVFFLYRLQLRWSLIEGLVQNLVPVLYG